MPPRLSPRRRFIAACARTFLPIAGPLIARYERDKAMLERAFAPFDAPEPGARLLVFSPHPDDETLGAGGLITRCRAQGIAVRIVFATNGDGSRTTQLVLNARRPLQSQTLFQIAQIRQLEALAAAAKLGVNERDVAFLGFPDGALKAVLRAQSPVTSPTTGRGRVQYACAVRPNALYTRESLLEVLQNEIDAFRPTLALTTHPRDTHADHSACFMALEIALGRAELPAPPQLATFLIHFGIWPVPNGFHPDLPLAPPAALAGENWRQLALSHAEIRNKRCALSCHATQLASTPRYLNAFVRRTELFTAPVTLARP